MAGFLEKVRQFFTLEEEILSSEEVMSDSGASTPARRDRHRGTLISLPSPRKQEILILEPGSFAEAREIAEALKAKKCILLSMRRTDKELARRIVDFLSGISYAIDGFSQKVAEQIYLFTPGHIEILVPDRSLGDSGGGLGTESPPVAIGES